MSRLEMPDENAIYARSRGFVERSATGRARLVSAREGAGWKIQEGITPVWRRCWRKRTGRADPVL